jgi:metallophosphoesterase (TIGR03768 family)
MTAKQRLAASRIFDAATPPRQSSIAKGNSMMKDNPDQGSVVAISATVTGSRWSTFSAGTLICLALSPWLVGCNDSKSQVKGYPIDSKVLKTTERMITFPYSQPVAAPEPGVMPTPADPAQSPNGGNALTWDQLNQTTLYKNLGYGQWQYLDQPLPLKTRTDLMPESYDAGAVTEHSKLLNFVAMTDIHLTDKEAPNQLIYMQQHNPGNAGQNTSIYSGVMSYTPQLFDAAVQTANALHKRDPFDFFISLGDVSNTSMYNELRWYLDILDGKVITPSSGDHRGADSVDYQKPFQAAGLNKSIPIYQTLGNHDHFMIGSFPVYESNLQDSYLSDSIWAVPDELLTPNSASFSALFNKNRLDPSNPDTATLKHYYQGVIDGATKEGAVIHTGSEDEISSAPKVVADPDRRALHREEWIHEFFNTTSSPVGHGFNLVASNPNYHLVPENERAGFACYSFVPKSSVPLKVIVLDDTQREDDGSIDIHGHGYLDATRWAWLQAELDDGQRDNQLMIIAAHIPIAVSNIGTELEWWLGAYDAQTNPFGDKSTTATNAVTITDLVNKLQNTPNLLMWIAGHRHLNHIKAFVSPDRDNEPEKGFWQVETSSLRDFPQQFRTFEIFLNSDYSVAIEAVDVDPAVAEGTPAATSREMAIAAQQIVHNNLTNNPVNYQKLNTALPPTDPTPCDPDVAANPAAVPLPTMDPTRKQGAIQYASPACPNEKEFTDPSIQYLDLTAQGIPYNASYNARLYKSLSPTMKARMQELFPAQ